uniref:Uncharacterized protein n=1 Tax=Oncorhynchus kisutch TaxID=8019 RepID=A0A8C7H5L7_ONCKI
MGSLALRTSTSNPTPISRTESNECECPVLRLSDCSEPSTPQREALSKPLGPALWSQHSGLEVDRLIGMAD